MENAETETEEREEGADTAGDSEPADDVDADPIRSLHGKTRGDHQPVAKTNSAVTRSPHA